MRPDPTRCLLLIDDEPAQRRLITAIGARAGWWVRGATDLEAAQKMMSDPQEPKFDAILLDHWLPGEEGTELIGKPLGFEEIVGSAPEFRVALAVAAKAARARVSVLIEGESGSGKEIIAQAIHAASPRGKKPLHTVNCGAIPENLVESVLFGHEKGSFTGAFDRHIGRFEDADGSTLFLDEVGELTLENQVKLLRALETGEIQRVGGRITQTVDVRIIAATNRRLAEEVAAGRFR